MANNLNSNFTEKLAKTFLNAFETQRVLSKNVNTQLLSGAFDADTGDAVSFKRPTDYRSERTADGDISATTKKDIITGKATGRVQDYFTVEVDYSEADQAIKMGNLDELLEPAARRIVTDLEIDFAKHMMKNAGLLAGEHGQPVSTWNHVAAAGALMEAAGIPKDSDWCYAVNPFTQTSLASNQRSLGAGGVAGKDVSEAHRRGILSDNFAGMKVMSATSLATHLQPSGLTDRAGTLSSAPNVTYVGAKDTMTQTLAVTGMGSFTGTVPAGTMIKVTGRNRLNMSTRQPILDQTGANVVWTAVVTTDATLTSGAGSLVCSGPAIYEANGGYNTVDTALASGDIVTILGNAGTRYQPNLFWHKNAFAIGSVPIKKLYSTDTLATTKDGLQIRVSRGSSIRENKQIVRFDLRPAYAVLNPFFAGQGFGEA